MMYYQVQNKVSEHRHATFQFKQPELLEVVCV